MADRILTVYGLDPKTNMIHRKRINGDEVIEDKIVANYDAEKQIVTFPNRNALRLYKEGTITFLAENELIVKSMQLGDMKPDKPLSDKSIPPRPKKSNLEGDKTPAVVEWYKRYRWNEFCARYGYLGKYSGVVVSLEPLWEKRPGDGQLEYRGQEKLRQTVVDAIVATRKTHCTFTPEECCGDEDKGIPGWSEEDAEMEAPDQAATVSARGHEQGED